MEIFKNAYTVEINDGAWTKKEHIVFLEALIMYGKSWADVQTLV